MSKSAFRFDAEERPEGDGLEVRNVSADPAAMPKHLMPRRPQPSASDPFHAEYVDQRPAARERMVSGRFGRKMDDVPAGTRPTPGSFEHYGATMCHRHPRDHRPAPHARDWSTATAEPVVGHGYPPPVYDGSAATLGARPSDAEFHGRTVPNYARDYPVAFRAEIEEADNG